MREQIARIRCLYCEEYSHHKEACLLAPNVTPFCPEALSIADQILSYQREKIEKVENPYAPTLEVSHYEGFGNAKARILSLLKEVK